LIGKKGSYAIKVILFFAFSKKESFSIKEISDRLGIPEKVLEQVLLLLKNKGILASKRGPQGGYWLAADVSEMTLLDCLEITGQRIDIVPAGAGREKLIDEVLAEVGASLQKDVMDRMGGSKIKDMVILIGEKVTEKGLSYMI